jgi:dihydroorotate dehydrogenase (NAD+) catalytic subunit
MADLSVDIGSLKLKNPVILASGTCGPELQRFTDLSKLGAIITKTVTLNPRVGNPSPRTFETHCGMLNSIGLENPGIDAFIAEKLPEFATLNTKVIVSIAGDTFSSYVEVARKLDDTKADALEINVSCPNVEKGGVEFGDKESVYRLAKEIKGVTSKSIIMKLSPNISKLEEVAISAENGGADAVSLINTLYGLAVDVDTKEPQLGGITGGLSGPCIKPVALYYVYKVKEAINVPVIGMGGISSTSDALEFLIVGASAVEIGTANFINPNIGVEIVEGLNSYCNKNKINRLAEVINSRAF